ncbi:MAG: peptidoglycan bridge formation glycyltransferase FemA/FemB family protein [Bacteroidales bacterium]|nr:peptidoglycan bridge formation glycyltransferase FemA/FemB family protein [Bacteroidales bacterium]
MNMTGFRCVRIEEKESDRWNSFYLNSVYPVFSGSLSYLKAQKTKGRTIETFILEDNNENVAGAHYTLKSYFGGALKTADILSGIFFKNNLTYDALFYLIEHFIEWAVQKKASYVRIAPGFPNTIAGENSGYQAVFDEVFKRPGLQEIEKGRHTYWIDMTHSENQLLMGMQPQTRRKIRSAASAGLDVEYHLTYEEEKFMIFWELYQKLGKRKGFNMLSKERFREKVKAFLDAGACLFFLKYKGHLINIALATNYGIGYYYHGALNEGYKNLEGCPSSGHYMQWVIIQYLKGLGLKTYDMAGCPGPVPVPGHPRFDMWRFKYGFGGDHVQMMPVYGKVLKPLRGNLFQYMLYKK